MASYGRGGFDSLEAGTAGYQRSAGQSGSANDFSRLQNAISSSIQRIAQHTTKSQRLVTQIGTSQDTKSLTAELKQIQQTTNDLIRTTNAQLKDLAEIVRHSPGHEKRQREIQKQRLADEFTKTLNLVQKVQREAADKERESVKRARAHSGSSNPFADNDSYGIGYNDDFGQTGRPETKASMQAVLEEEENLTAIREREEALKSLESDIMDVNQIFKDLGQLVHEQGDMIDSIESNVESAAVNVESANVQLEQAREYQSAARKKKCICAIILVVVLIVVILAIVIPVVIKKKNNNQ